MHVKAHVGLIKRKMYARTCECEGVAALITAPPVPRQDVSVKAVVLTANGKFFCAGGDLREMAGFGDQGGVQIKSLAEGSLGANSMIKRLLLSTWNNDLESQMDAETKGISQCLSSEDGQEGMRAFLEKRKPVFM